MTAKGSIKDMPQTSTAVCQDCGAVHFSPASHCWLCLAPLGPQSRDTTKPVEAELVGPEFSGQAVLIQSTYMRYTEPIFAVCTIGALILLGLIGIGCAVDNQTDTLIGFLVFTVPPLIGSLIYLLRRKATGGNLTWMEGFITLIASAAVTLGLFIMLIVAIIAILFMACFGIIMKGSL